MKKTMNSRQLESSDSSFLRGIFGSYSGNDNYAKVAKAESKRTSPAYNVGEEGVDVIIFFIFSILD